MRTGCLVVWLATTSMQGQYIGLLYRPCNPSAVSTKFHQTFYGKYPRSFQTKFSVRPFTQGTIAVQWATTWDSKETWICEECLNTSFNTIETWNYEESWVAGPISFMKSAMHWRVDLPVLVTNWRLKTLSRATGTGFPPPYRKVLDKTRSANRGLANIFLPTIKMKICRGKCPPRNYLYFSLP